MRKQTSTLQKSLAKRSSTLTLEKECFILISKMQAACDLIPGIAAFTNFCNSQHVPLLYKNASLQSESGVQQGDPLGPLLFVDVTACYRKIKDTVPNLTKQTWYLDDCSVAGSEDQIRTTLDILANESPKKCLYLRKDTCKLWSIVDLP